MWPLAESLKRTNREYEAVENNETLGRIVIEDAKTVVLCEVDTNKVLLEITDENKVDLLNNDERVPVTRKDILSKKASDGDHLLYVGLESFVK